MNQIRTSGKLLYLHLPVNAYGMRKLNWKGYVAGRFRSPGWIILESEYRFPIVRNGLSGGVVFASATTASREAIMIVDTNFEQQNLAEANRLAGGYGPG